VLEHNQDSHEFRRQNIIPGELAELIHRQSVQAADVLRARIPGTLSRGDFNVAANSEKSWPLAGNQFSLLITGEAGLDAADYLMGQGLTGCAACAAGWTHGAGIDSNIPRYQLA